MAVSTVAYSQHEFMLGIAKQSAFGTRNSTQGDFQHLFLTTRPEVVSGVVEDRTKRADGSVILSTTDLYRTGAGGEYTIPIEGVLTKEQAAKLIYAVCGAITSEADTTPYAKVFTFGTGRTVPSTPGYVFTTLLYDPSGQNVELQDCVLKTLTLSFSPGASGGRVAFSGTIYSGHIPDYDSVTATPSTPWIAAGTNYYGMSELDRFATDVGGGDVDLTCAGWTLTIENGAKRFGIDASGNAQGIAIGAGPSGIQISGEFVTKYDANTKQAYTYFMGGNTWPLYISYNATSSADFLIALNGYYSGEPKKDFGQEAGVHVTIPFIGAFTDATPALLLTVEDASDRAWT